MQATTSASGGPRLVKPSADGAAPATALLFEICGEVCSQVGGIYTVLRSKAPSMVRRWGDDYFLIGPYREASARVELEPQPPPDVLASAVRDAEQTGMRVHMGRWLITGRPRVMLLDTAGLRHRLGEMKYYLWRDNGIGSHDQDHEFDDNILFGFAVADLLAAVRRRIGGRPMLAHFHEWQAAVALPVLRHRWTDVATVFTTHATLVGRNLCAANADIYDHMGSIDAGQAAAACGYGHRHAVEGAAAQAADVFTTVSGITAMEARQFLGRQADVLLPNGLNVSRFAAPHEFQVLHREAKERIHEFVIGHFFPSYTFDLDRTLYVFTAGRYEYRNKGLDLFIEALHELNQRLRSEGSAATVVAFIITRAATRALNVDTLNRQAMFNELRDTCGALTEEMGRRLFQTVATGRLPSLDDLLDEYDVVRLKRMMYSWRGGPLPAIVTHDVIDDGGDPTLRHLRHRQFFNAEHDRVKVVFHPDFVSIASPLFGMDYDQFVRGCHLGVFPSYYEPWGYTPLECIVSGVPTITSDLSGFGDYLMENLPNHDEMGMWVARRRGRTFGETVAQVAGWMHALCGMTRRERIALRNRTESNAEHFDWSRLVRPYWAAHEQALERRYPGAAAMPADPDAAAAPAVTAKEAAPKRRRRT